MPLPAQFPLDGEKKLGIALFERLRKEPIDGNTILRDIGHGHSPVSWTGIRERAPAATLLER
jgi:hypothetical protein